MTPGAGLDRSSRWWTVTVGVAAAAVLLVTMLMTRLPSAFALAAAPGTWSCGGQLRVFATDVPVDFDLFVSSDGWWATDDGRHQGTWRVDGGEVEITAGGATNVVPATLDTGASRDQQVAHPSGMSMALQVQAAGLDAVHVRVGTPNLLQGDYSCRKVSNDTPSAPSSPSTVPDTTQVVDDLGEPVGEVTSGATSGD